MVVHGLVFNDTDLLFKNVKKYMMYNNNNFINRHNIIATVTMTSKLVACMHVHVYKIKVACCSETCSFYIYAV